MTTDPLTQILSSAEAVLFDFDGPICSVFDGYPAHQITQEFLGLAHRIRGATNPKLEKTTSPHELLLLAADDTELARSLEVALQNAELTAIATARPTPGASECIAACAASGRLVAIVSNNYALAVARYLESSGLTDGVAHIEGRDSSDPELMKPDPYLLQRSAAALGIPASSCVFIGDQATDIQAGLAAGVPVIGYANKPGKIEILEDAGAKVILTDMFELSRRLM